MEMDSAVIFYSNTEFTEWFLSHGVLYLDSSFSGWRCFTLILDVADFFWHGPIDFAIISKSIINDKNWNFEIFRVWGNERNKTLHNFALYNEPLYTHPRQYGVNSCFTCKAYVIQL